ncbi:MAG: hypothetical protein RI979_1437, partial [Pseudomonadota bacterium]
EPVFHQEAIVDSDGQTVQYDLHIGVILN